MLSFNAYNRTNDESVSYCIGEELIMESTLRSDSEQSMPYMLGWHPAFRIATDERTRVFAGEKSYTIEEIKQASRTGALLLEADIITYKGNDRYIELSHSFGKAMLWSPDARYYV